MKHGGVMRRIASGLTAAEFLAQWRARWYGAGTTSTDGPDEIIIDVRVMRPEHERKAA